jgi:hypothetical protein
MSTYPAGQPIVSGFWTGVSGEAITVNVSRDPNGDPFLIFPDNFTDLGGGDWLLTFTPDTPGNWYARGIGATSGEGFVGNWDVDPAVVSPAAPVVSTSGSSRQELRRMIGRRLPGEQFTALTATGGSTTDFKDTENAQGPNDAYKGSELYIVSGSALNVGKTRRVQSSNQMLGQLNWGTPLPAAIGVGDNAELWNVRGVGTTAVQVNDAINDAIMMARKHAWMPIEANVSLAFDQDSPTVTLPGTITKGFFGLDFQDWQYPDKWHEIDGGGEFPRVGWWYDRGAGKIVIGGYWANAANGRTLRVRGYGFPAVLNADTDTTSIDPEWIVTEAVRILLQKNVMKNADNERWFQPASAESAVKRGFAIGRKASNTIVL